MNKSVPLAVASLSEKARVCLDANAADVAGARVPDFVEIYDAYGRFVLKALLRLGVSERAVEDAVQEVFLIVHRRLGDFEGRSSVRTWVYGIAVRVARNYRRARQRRPFEEPPGTEVDESRVSVPPDAIPDKAIEKAEALKLAYSILEKLDDDLREILVLIEFEQMSVPEVATILGAKTNTVYSRLRAARMAFNALVENARARDEWRLR